MTPMANTWRRLSGSESVYFPPRNFVSGGCDTGAELRRRCEAMIAGPVPKSPDHGRWRRLLICRGRMARRALVPVLAGPRPRCRCLAARNTLRAASHETRSGSRRGVYPRRKGIAVLGLGNWSYRPSPVAALMAVDRDASGCDRRIFGAAKVHRVSGDIANCQQEIAQIA